MTTENGLAPPAQMRDYIERLRRRRDFLRDEIARTSTETWRPDFDIAELVALDWALPVLEAEWHNVVALRKRILRHEAPREAKPPYVHTLDVHALTQRGTAICEECGPIGAITADDADDLYEEHVMDRHAPSVRYEWDPPAPSLTVTSGVYPKPH